MRLLGGCWGWETDKLSQVGFVQFDLASRELHDHDDAAVGKLLDGGFQLSGLGERGGKANTLVQRNVNGGLELVPGDLGDSVGLRLRTGGEHFEDGVKPDRIDAPEQHLDVKMGQLVVRYPSDDIVDVLDFGREAEFLKRSVRCNGLLTRTNFEPGNGGLRHSDEVGRFPALDGVAGASFFL